jgi:hypothetical protein
MRSVMPPPFKLFLRLLFASVIVLAVVITARNQLAKLIVPITRETMNLVQAEFVVQSVDAVAEASGEVIRLRANLARPVEIGGRRFYPVGYGTTHSGGYQVTMTLGGVIIYSMMTLIIVLAWPATGIKEALIRMMIAMPLMLLLLLVNIAITFCAELWTPIHNAWLPDINWRLLQCSRMLMDGGGMVGGVVCGALVVVVSRSAVSNLK